MEIVIVDHLNPVQEQVSVPVGSSYGGEVSQMRHLYDGIYAPIEHTHVVQEITDLDDLIANVTQFTFDCGGF